MVKISQEEWDILEDLHMRLCRDLNGDERIEAANEKIRFFAKLGEKYGFNPHTSAIRTATREIVPLPDNWS